jgi:hypothetical protein
VTSHAEKYRKAASEQRSAWSYEWAIDDALISIVDAQIANPDAPEKIQHVRDILEGERDRIKAEEEG